MKFCPKCGLKTNDLYDGLCNECSANKMEIFEYNPKEISLCSSCNAIFDSGKQFKGKNNIQEAILNRIKINEKIDGNIKLNINFEEKKAILKLKGKAPGKVILNEEYSLPFKIKEIICEGCSKKKTTYFEGILQIRNDDQNKVKKALDELYKIMEIEEKRRVFATNIVEMKKGADVYITSQKHIKEIGKKLFSHFGGEIKINEQLFSRDHLRSKHLYRVNVLIRLPDYEIGNVIKVKDKIIYLKNIDGYFIIGKNINDGKSIKINIKDSDVKIISKEINETMITITNPHLEVLHPETYQSEIIKNPEIIKNKKKGDKILVVDYKGLWVIK